MTSIDSIWLAARRGLAAAAWLLVAAPACGSSEADRPSSPSPSQGAGDAAPAPPAPDRPAARPTTPDECRAAGGTFVPSIGGEPSCPQGMQSLGPIRHGIEGGLCCK